MKIQEYDYKPIGHRIKKVREEKGYTQGYVAEKMGVGDKHISGVERGLTGVSIGTLMQLCKILDTDADYILFGKLTEGNNNPFNKLMKQLTPAQALYAEGLLEAYANSCINK